MFERYTEKARRVIFFARYEASQFGTPAIEPEHLLLGILREDRPLVKRLLGEDGSSVEIFRREIEARLHVSEKIATSVELPLADGTKRVLAYAHEESEALNHRHIGTEHFLLGLLREGRSVAAELLSERGLELEKARAQFEAGEAEASVSAASASARPSSRGVAAELRHLGLGIFKLADQLEAGESMGEKFSGVDEGRASEESRPGGAEGKRETSGGVRVVRKGRRLVLGIEKLLGEKHELLKGARVGLVCNQSSVNHEFRHAADLLHEHRGVNLTTLFGPQHGIRGDVQDNMVETPHAEDAQTGLPVYSLYSETREPTEQMLSEVDALVFDMQDVGCRIYTFIYTLANCMRAARRLGKRVVVCDRPNPLNGVQLGGNLLEPGYESFVGQFPLPTRHGMTVCELARMFQTHFGLGGELEVVTMDGWSREHWFDETDAPWVLPSPNMPTLDSATVFPGTVHLEGTQMSEGRGTTRPFELIGAPYVEAAEYARRLESIGFEGVRFRAANFLPTFQKHKERACGGVQIHVTDRRTFEPVIVGVAAVKTAYDLYGEHFRWKEPPYEYVFDKNPFDVIAGTSRLREQIEGGASLEEIETSWGAGLAEFARIRERFLLY